MDKQYYIDNHIGIFKNFMPNELIDDYTNYFNKCEQQGAVYPRKEDELLVSITPPLLPLPFPTSASCFGSALPALIIN